MLDHPSRREGKAVSGPDVRIDRLVAAFLLGAVLLNPPLLSVFDVGAETRLFGIPVLFVYVFVAWLAVIALAAAAIGRGRPAPPDERG